MHSSQYTLTGQLLLTQNIFCLLFYLILTTIPEGRCHYHPCSFMKTLESKVGNLPKAILSYQVTDLRSEPGPPTLWPHSLSTLCYYIDILREIAAMLKMLRKEHKKWLWLNDIIKNATRPLQYVLLLNKTVNLAPSLTAKSMLSEKETANLNL